MQSQKTFSMTDLGKYLTSYQNFDIYLLKLLYIFECCQNKINYDVSRFVHTWKTRCYDKVHIETRNVT